MRSLFCLPAALALAACTAGSAAAPDLPQSVSPAWSRKSLTRESNDCWKVEYASAGSALVKVCRYSSDAVALNAVQRMQAQPNTVDFQQGSYFVIVSWSNVSQAEITALVRAVQKSLQAH